MKPWNETWGAHRGGAPEIDFDTAQERGKFMTEAAKILLRLDPQLLQVQGLRGDRDLGTLDEILFEDHVEALAFDWHTRT